MIRVDAYCVFIFKVIAQNLNCRAVHDMSALWSKTRLSLNM